MTSLHATIEDFSIFKETKHWFRVIIILLLNNACEYFLSHFQLQCIVLWYHVIGSVIVVVDVIIIVIVVVVVIIAVVVIVVVITVSVNCACIYRMNVLLYFVITQYIISTNTLFWKC